MENNSVDEAKNIGKSVVDRETEQGFTPGPWFWNVNLKGRQITLESQGRGRMLETVIDFTRWGTGGAAPRFRNGDDIMQRADELTERVAGREHHAHWYQTISHPDARLIAAAPSLATFLMKIYLDYEDDCNCECDSENCCAVVGEKCAKCHANVALLLLDQPASASAKRPISDDQQHGQASKSESG